MAQEARDEMSAEFTQRKLANQFREVAAVAHQIVAKSTLRLLSRTIATNGESILMGEQADHLMARANFFSVCILFLYISNPRAFFCIFSFYNFFYN